QCLPLPEAQVEPARSFPPSRSRLLLRALALSSALLAACHSSSPSKSLQSIGVTPANPSLAVGSNTQLTATGTYSDHSTQDLTSAAGWTSSDVTVATVSSTGLVIAVASGTTTVTD